MVEQFNVSVTLTLGGTGASATAQDATNGDKRDGLAALKNATAELRNDQIDHIRGETEQDNQSRLLLASHGQISSIGWRGKSVG